MVVCSTVLFSVALSITCLPVGGQTLPFRDPKLSIDQRVNDLVSRMTLEEKISQMMNAAAPIERLGVPEYEWWNEALHGVARAGIATVFPQAIGLAATFDEKLIQDVADATSTEARAKNNEFLRLGERGRYKGLTFWSPNINLFRDPRWGRGQETWGEDPYLTGLLGSAFIRGLQGNDPKYLKSAAAVKHYAVHSGPEPERHSFDAVVSKRDLNDSYLPQFRTTILEANPSGLMCAYNRVNGLPACASKELGDILFKKWKFAGHVVSDCGAIDNIFLRHKFVETMEEASAIAVKGGTDLTCGREYRVLADSIKKGYITEAQIDTAVKNLMKVRFQLGMFDPPEMVAFTKIPFSENDSPANHKLSLEASRRSLVLLKNHANALPLKKDLKVIAVIGPNADDRDVLLGNYNGEPSVWTTPLAGIRKIVSPTTRIQYSQGMWPEGQKFDVVDTSALMHGNTAGLKGEYFATNDFSGEPIVRIDQKLDFNWSASSPIERIAADGFSVRWTGKLRAPDSGNYVFGGRSNGPLRIWLDGKLIVEEVTNKRTRNAITEISLEAGRLYDIKVEYQEQSNTSAQVRFVWKRPSTDQALRSQAMEMTKQSDAVIMVMGISPRVEGEEMDVKLEGFRGGDRTEISLPKAQQQLIKDIHALGKPVVLVTMGGSALALNWENENLAAIIHAWYPGQFGGAAIAETIFGDYNPAGRLPVTFYKSVDQLPPFDDYKMEGRTYRYFRGEPLYPFGYGLSYSQFKYSGLKLPSSLAIGQDAKVAVSVQNISKIAGEEVLQVYLTDRDATSVVPLRSLVGVQRIKLRPGEMRKLEFTVKARQMSRVLDSGARVLEPGMFDVSIGGGQPTGSTKTHTGSMKLTGRTLTLPE